MAKYLPGDSYTVFTSCNKELSVGLVFHASHSDKFNILLSTFHGYKRCERSEKEVDATELVCGAQLIFELIIIMLVGTDTNTGLNIKYCPDCKAIQTGRFHVIHTDNPFRTICL